MTTRQILIAAKELIAEPERWTQYVEARRANGTQVDCLSPSACRFCVMGALICAAPYEPWLGAEQTLNMAASRVFGIGAITTINDHHGFDAVHIVLDEAIARCEE